MLGILPSLQLVFSLEQDRHWKQSRLLRAFPSAPWEEFVPWCPCVGAESSTTLLGSRSVSWTWVLARARRELNFDSAAPKEADSIAGLLWEVDCTRKDGYSVLLPSLPHPLQQRWWAASWLLACSWTGPLHTFSYSGQICGAQQLLVTFSDSLTGICFLNNGCTLYSAKNCTLRGFLCFL